MIYVYGLYAPKLENCMLLLLVMAHRAACNNYFKIGARNARRGRWASSCREMWRETHE
jgi:hypothetical protein